MQHPCNKVWEDTPPEPEPEPLTEHPGGGTMRGDVRLIRGGVCEVWTGQHWQRLNVEIDGIGYAWSEADGGRTHIDRALEFGIKQRLPDCPAANETLDIDYQGA